MLLLLLQRAGPRARPSSSCLRDRAWLLSRGLPESQSREAYSPSQEILRKEETSALEIGRAHV